MKKLTAFLLSVILLVSVTFASALAEGTNLLNFVSTYYWALGYYCDDIYSYLDLPSFSAFFVSNQKNDENYAFYSLHSGGILVDSRTGKIVSFLASSSLDSYEQSFMASIVLGLEYDFEDLRVSQDQEEHLEKVWNTVSNIVKKVYIDGSYETDCYIYSIDSSKLFQALEKDYAAAAQQ